MKRRFIIMRHKQQSRGLLDSCLFIASPMLGEARKQLSNAAFCFFIATPIAWRGKKATSAMLMLPIHCLSIFGRQQSNNSMLFVAYLLPFQARFVAPPSAKAHGKARKQRAECCLLFLC
jgi:hypothetical protein